MTIRNLQIFIEVAKSGSMSDTAKKLYLSQPTISHAISSLEQEYHTRLFDRSPQRLYLTQSGRLLYSEAYNVIQAITHLNDVMHEQEENSPISVGASVTVAVSILDSVIEEFKKHHPQMEVKLLISNTSAIETAMENNEIDLAIVSGEIHNPLIETCKIIQDYQVCVCRSDHYMAGTSNVTLEELCREKFVMLLSDRWTRAAFEKYVHDKGYSLNIICECSNTGLVKERILKGHGITIISARVVEKELLAGQLSLIHCDGCSWQRPFVLAYRKQKYLSRAFRDFIQIAKDYDDNNVLKLI